MSEKSSILADRVGKIIINEMRGISSEVREWASIIKDVVDGEYKKYLDDQNKRFKPYHMGNSFGFNTGNKNKISEEDLALMDSFEVDQILDDIMYFHNLSFTKIMELKPKDVVKYYNQIPKGFNLNEEVTGDPIPKPTQIIINGKDYPNLYDRFSVDKWVITDKSLTEYDHVNSGYKDGEYTVLINCQMSNISMYVLIHEIKHAYQDWQRMSKNRPPIRDSKEIQQLYTKDFEKYILSHRGSYTLNTLDSIISAYYMSSDAEITAYLEGAYDEIHNNQTQPAGNIYEFGKSMVKFKASDVEPKVKPTDLQKKWKDIIDNYDIPLFRKFKNVFDFLKYTEKLFNKKGGYIVNKVDKLRTMDKNKIN